MTHPYASTGDVPPHNTRNSSEPPLQHPVDQSGTPPPPLPCASPAQRSSEAHISSGGSSSSIDQSRNLSPESKHDADALNCSSKLDTFVSHTDDVSSSSSSASSPSTSSFSSRTPSNAFSSESHGPSNTPACKREGGVGGEEGAAEPDQHLHECRRHHGQLHADPDRRHNHSGRPELPSAPAPGEEGEGYMGGSETSSPKRVASRVQISELTRFKHALAAGARGTAEPCPVQRSSNRSTNTSLSDTTLKYAQQQRQRWGDAASKVIFTPSQPPSHCLSTSATSSPQPHCYASPMDTRSAPASFSPSPVRMIALEDETAGAEARLGGEGVAACAAAAPTTTRITTTTAAASATSRTCQHIQRSHSASAAVSFPQSAATLPTRSTLLPPPHPRRSASAQSRASRSPSGQGSLRNNSKSTGPIRVSQTLFARNSSGCCSPPFSGADVLPSASHSVGGGNSTPPYQAALHRSSSFTAGVLPPAGSWAADIEGHPYAFNAATLASTTGASAWPLHSARVPLQGERLHERTPSVASSLHSASSSVRPSVPLPPLHVPHEPAMMAAVWVDIPNSQSCSRCATPVNNYGSDTQQHHKHRRTTPRRGSEPPSPATSTLAASIVSSEGIAQAPSSVAVAAAALASMRMRYVTVGTQTHLVYDDVTDAPTTLEGPWRQGGSNDARTTSPALTVESYSTPEKTVRVVDDEAQQQQQQQQQHPSLQVSSAIALPPMAESVSSTSAEVSPRSFRIGPTDTVFEASALDANVASKPPGSTHAVRTDSGACGGCSAVTEVPAVTVAAAPSRAYQQAHRAGEPLSLAAGRGEGGTVSPLSVPSKEVAKEAGTGAPPAGVIVSPVTPELQTVPCALQLSPNTEGDAAPPIEHMRLLPRAVAQTCIPHSSERSAETRRLSQPAGVPCLHPSRQTGVEGQPEVKHPSASFAGGGGSDGSGQQQRPSAAARAAPNSSLAQAEEVQRLRSELAHVRTQYAVVLEQLRRMQRAEGAAPAAGPGAAVAQIQRADNADDVSPVSRSPSVFSSSSFDPTLSTSLNDESAAAAAAAPYTAASSSDADAAATLQHVREALERTRRRTNA
ncbi:hypothetical protein ABL78_3361 [Leptomonas seymouri]|uniref:Uncharacterized protein n=1 Tax=Leptomonas seymouri TaxID=5684 RepID=A0A0N1PES6_LEPSE|nr:hypothetical protein ABL78_3361 [Leptomonas seymouri]|eukprot:KPI87564.1 hypothetical protein ABL78_3361 [Leptomonas seymouri]